MAAPSPGAARGFTLLEILVAMTIFALISVMTFQGLREMTTSRARLEEEGARLAALQTAFAIIGRDLGQGVERRIRDEYGNLRPPISGGEREADAVELSRGGFANPGGRPRSSIQRVAYRLTGHELIRRSWPVLDRVSNTTPASQVVLRGVTGFKVEFMDSSRRWRPSWPPEEEASTRQSKLPKALRVTLELEEWGKITRLFPTGAS